MEIYYENSKGECIHMDAFPFVLQEPEVLLGNDWQYNSVTDSSYRNTITGFYQEIAEKSVTLSVFADSREEYVNIMENLHTVTEWDVLNVSPGKLHINGYYLRCYVAAREYAEYEEDFYAVENTIKFLSENPMWIREKKYYFGMEDATSTDNKRYPHKYRYRYANGLKDTYVENDYIKACHFELMIMGKVLNPEVIIGERPYTVYTYLEDGERLIINSETKTVTKIMRTGTEVNLFDSRDKKNSVFHLIVPGRNTVRWSGKFEFYLTIWEERSEPKWQ